MMSSPKVIQLIRLSFKDVEVYDNGVVTIHHKVSEECTTTWEEDNDELPPQEFLDSFTKRVRKSYQLGEELGWCRIIAASPDHITTEMPFYDILLNKKDLSNYIPLFKPLFKKLHDNNILHDDIALRNIGYDNETKSLRFIDLSSLFVQDKKDVKHLTTTFFWHLDHEFQERNHEAELMELHTYIKMLYCCTGTSRST